MKKTIEELQQLTTIRLLSYYRAERLRTIKAEMSVSDEEMTEKIKYLDSVKAILDTRENLKDIFQEERLNHMKEQFKANAN